MLRKSISSLAAVVRVILSLDSRNGLLGTSWIEGSIHLYYLTYIDLYVPDLRRNPLGIMGYYYIGGEPYSSRQWSIVLVTSFLLAFSTLAVALRLYARRLTAAVLYLDDKIIIVALVSDLILIFSDTESGR